MFSGFMAEVFISIIYFEGKIFIVNFFSCDLSKTFKAGIFLFFNI